MSNRDPVAAAVAATDAELFHAALNGDESVHDDTDDRSLEQQDDGLEGAVEDVGEEEEVEAAADDAEGEGEVEGDAKPKPVKDPKTGQFVKKDAEAEAEEAEVAGPSKGEQTGRVPPARLREETARARAAEAERDALKAAREDDRREREAIKAQMDLLARQVMQRQQPQTQQPKVEAPQRPDMFADPDGYNAWVENQIARVRSETSEDYSKRLINMNLAHTREVHGEKFDAAYQEIISAAQAEPEARIAIQKIWHSDNPGGELLRWHRDRVTLREVGGDPESYKQKLRDETRAALLADPEFRKEMLAGLRADASGNGAVAPRHVTRVPTNLRSLNSASGSSHVTDQEPDDGSDDALFQHALRTG